MTEPPSLNPRQTVSAFYEAIKRKDITSAIDFFSDYGLSMSGSDRSSMQIQLEDVYINQGWQVLEYAILDEYHIHDYLILVQIQVETRLTDKTINKLEVWTPCFYEENRWRINANNIVDGYQLNREVSCNDTSIQFDWVVRYTDKIQLFSSVRNNNDQVVEWGGNNQNCAIFKFHDQKYKVNGGVQCPPNNQLDSIYVFVGGWFDVYPKEIELVNWKLNRKKWSFIINIENPAASFNEKNNRIKNIFQKDKLSDLKNQGLNSKRLGFIRSFIIIGILLLFSWVIGSNFYRYIEQGKRFHTNSLDAYKRADCQSAIPLFQKVEGYPTILHRLIGSIDNELGVCLSYQELLQRTAVSQEDPNIIEHFNNFMQNYPDSPLSPIVLDKIGNTQLETALLSQDVFYFDQSIHSFEQLKALSPDYETYVEEKILFAQIAKGEMYINEKDFENAISLFESELFVNNPLEKHPSLKYQKDHLHKLAYIQWASSLREDGEFINAINIYENFNHHFPEEKQQIEQSIFETYLELGTILIGEKKYLDAIGLFEEYSSENKNFEAFISTTKTQAILDYASELFDEEDYKGASDIYISFIEDESKRLDPLPLPTFSIDFPQPYPYGLAKVRLSGNELIPTLKSGPGNSFRNLEFIGANLPSYEYFPVVGKSIDGEWYAISVDSPINQEIVVTGLALRDLEWIQPQSVPIVWVPITEVELIIEAETVIPATNLIAVELANKSDSVAIAFDGLIRSYLAEAQQLIEEENFVRATELLVTSAEITLQQSEREAIWVEISQLNLHAAELFANSADYKKSAFHALIAIDYDVEEEIGTSARMLLLESLFSLGNQAIEEEDWEAAFGYFNNVLNIELDTYTKGNAVVIGNNSKVYEFPSFSSQSFQTVLEGQEFPMLAQFNDSTRDWISIYFPVFETAQVWIPASQISLTIPITDVIQIIDTSSITITLEGRNALVNLARTNQLWGQTLHESFDYEEAISHYEIILNDWAQQQVITGTEELAARSWIDWGNNLVTLDVRDEAVQKYSNAINVASGTDEANEANSAIVNIMDNVTQLVNDGFGCSEVPVISALLVTNLAQRANQIFPQAIYQCGGEQLGRIEFDDARESYQRVIDEFAFSNYRTRAERGLLRVDWVELNCTVWD